MKRCIVTWAQSDTPVHLGFWNAMKRLPAQERYVVRGYYRNPTSLYEKYKEEETSWDPVVAPFLVDSQIELVKGRLTLHANIRTQPTAGNPLSGMEVYAGRASAIIGHPKRQVTTVCTATRMPRLLMSTGACTVPNYSKSTAGAKGTAHHVLGALVVEVDDEGRFFSFQITWDDKTQSFTHLDTRYFADRKGTAPPALAIVVGDYHAGREDPEAVAATHEMFELMEPENIIWHDFFDNSARNHHESKSRRHRYAKRFRTVKEEVRYSATQIVENVRKAPYARHRFVRSNHDEALDRWMEEHDDNRDPVNTPYWHDLCARIYAIYDQTGEWSDAWPFEMGELLPHDVLERVHFLKRNEELRLCNVQCGFHYDKGINGSKSGGVQTYRKLGVKSIGGHGHCFHWLDGAMQVGTVSELDHGYNGLPNGWNQGNAVIYADGKRSFLSIIQGHWHINKRGR